LNDNKTYPPSYNIVNGSLGGGSLTNLQVSDDVYMSFNKGADNNVEVEFSGTISGHLPFIQVTVEAHLSTSRTPPYVLEVSAWNFQTGAYETSGSFMYKSVGIGTSDVNAYLFNLLGNKGKYVDANGNWKIKLKVTGDAGLGNPALYIDYICFRSVSFQLGTSQTAGYLTNDLDVAGGSVGIRVWGIKADETEVEITSGSSVAVVIGPSSTQTLSATWNCPATAQYVAFLVIVYLGTNVMRSADLASGGSPFIFMTEDLNSALSGATWTVYYAFYYNANLDQTFFRFGTTTYNSRIANFTWGAVSKAWHDVASWSFQLLTRKWNNISTFALTLQTRNWQNIASWTFNLITKTWHETATWIFQLQTQKWHEITSWIFELATKKWYEIGLWNFQTLTGKWNEIIQWMFQLGTKKWNNIAYWTWQTITYGWHIITQWTFTLITQTIGFWRIAVGNPDISILFIFFVFFLVIICLAFTLKKTKKR